MRNRRDSMKREELERIVAEIDWMELEEKITEAINIPVKLKIGIEEKPNTDEYRIRFASQELCKFTGIMSGAFNSVKIIDLGIAIDLEKGKVMVLVNYWWQLKCGGSDGCVLLLAVYNLKTRQWNFK